MGVRTLARSASPATSSQRAYDQPRPSTPRRVGQDAFAVAALAILATLITCALAADVLAFYVFGTTPTEQHLDAALVGPSSRPASMWLGSDELGRSQIVRLLYGARVSLGVAASAALLNVLIGVPIGLSAGYFGAWWDDVVQWLVATLHSVPRLFLLALISALFGPGPILLVLVLGLLTWPGIGLFVRGQTFALRERGFVLAARALGASHARIALRHILPNVLPLIVVLGAIDLGGLILTESALSFLGLGIQPPVPSWGNLLTTAASTLVRAPWLAIGPGAAIFVVVLSLYVAGDAIRDALDPRLRT